ncbi:transposase [Streptomyces actinomycinicus]|uniref:transposase n=1 Tax=Streptomyces actinomycinicus TaxID=1695166 RepID=UPI003558FD64
MGSRRCPSDTTNAERALLGGLLPTPAGETSKGGRSEKHPRREVVDAIRYVVDTGCKWRALPGLPALAHGLDVHGPLGPPPGSSASTAPAAAR